MQNMPYYYRASGIIEWFEERSGGRHKDMSNLYHKIHNPLDNQLFDLDCIFQIKRREIVKNNIDKF